MLRHRTLSRSKFLRAVGLGGLAAYAATRGLSPPDNAEDDTVDAWLTALSEPDRVSTLEDWQTINDVCDDAIDCLDLAYRRSSLVPDDDAPRERLAMRLFLEDRPSFEVAVDLSQWRDARLRMSHFRLPVSPGKRDIPDASDFEARVSAHFQQSLRSDKCMVRAYEEAGAWIFLVAHGDYQETRQAWTAEGPAPHFFRPARQDILQYNPTSGVFSMRIDGRPTREDQQIYLDAFSEQCLGVPARALSELETTISLDRIRDGNFRYEGNEHPSDAGAGYRRCVVFQVDTALYDSAFTLSG